jgi:nucleoside-diphosphate-sugar epimerase
MKTLVTGAGGFVGGALLRRLVETRAAGDEIIATDLRFPHTLPGVDYVVGEIDAPRLVADLVGRQPHRIVHLATVAGVLSATDFALGKRINLDATLALLDAIRSSGHRPRFIYSSSVGVFGPPLPDSVDDDTLAVPGNSYGAYKMACELLIADYSRAGFVEGLSLRFPGILARPEGSKTMLSAFMSNVFYAARRGEPFTLPLDPDDGSWLMSLRCCVDNVVHALRMPADTLPQRRYWNLPALRVTMRELVAALAEIYGPSVCDLVGYEPVEQARKMFSQVPLRTPGAERCGFIGDRTATDLVRNSIVGNPALEPG